MTSECEEAAKRGSWVVLREKLAEGADPDARDRYGQTALMLASQRGHLEAVRVLVEAGADLDHTAKYRLSALMLATLSDHEPVVRLLLEAGADRDLRGAGAPGFADKTALDLALDLGREAIAALLRAPA